MATAEKKLSLRLLIDNKSERVLYAEAGKDVVDFLFGLLALPLGRVSSLLSKELGMTGCVAALHNSLEQLDGSYIVSDHMKGTLLNTSSAASSSQISNAGLLLRPSSSAMKGKFYRCNYCLANYISEEYGTKCTKCTSGTMSSEMPIAGSKKVDVGGAEGGCVKGVVTYSVMDDLTVVPMSTISSIALLNKFHVKDLTALEEKSVVLGLQEALGLLKASLQSKTVLTDVFLGKYQTGTK